MLGLPAARIGDPCVPHCGPSAMAMCSPNVRVNMLGAVRQGDLNTPHLVPAGKFCAIHSAPVTFGSLTVRVNMRGMAHMWSSLASCTFIACGSHNVGVGGG